jgi:hypothetical protein
MFRKIHYVPMDALTIFIPKGQKPSPVVQKYLDEAGPCRWFPQDGGHLIKFPDVFKSYDDSLFKLEKNGWDHEHCDNCGNTISIDDECWEAESDENSYCLFCSKCYNGLSEEKNK